MRSALCFSAVGENEAVRLEYGQAIGLFARGDGRPGVPPPLDEVGVGAAGPGDLGVKRFGIGWRDGHAKCKDMRLNGGLFIHGLTLQYPLSFCKYKRKYTHMPGLRVKDGRPLLFDLALAAARSDHEAPFGVGCSRRDIDAVLPAIGQGHPAARTGVARIFLEAGPTFGAGTLDEGVAIAVIQVMAAEADGVARAHQQHGADSQNKNQED